MTRPSTPSTPAEARRVRCAIYTRKSTSEGLESDFNTLDAQREAAEFYVRAMRHEGWEALPDRYDDGGFTGGNIDRPALQRLLADIEAGKIDMVVVYKVDRLSRSLLDFAQLLALFEAKGVGFVSTTQQFNTLDAMGRLTLNIVVSFAQFEREMIADRTRDKMGAARKRGKWLGSRPPLGYAGDRERMRLVVVPEEAEQVRSMFQLYLRLGSAAEVATRVNALGWTRKQVKARAGHLLGGGPWDEKDVHMLLRNPLYIGKVDFKGALYDGEHAAIVDPVLFDRVQRTLDSKTCGRGQRRGRNPEYLLQSIITCGLCGGPMTTASGEGRKREVYRYYACRNRVRKTATTCDHPRISAPEVEKLVVGRVSQVCADADMRARIARRMSVTEPEMAARLQAERAEVEARRVALRTEAERLMKALGSGGGSLLADRISEIERELEPIHGRLAAIDGQMRSLQFAAEQVTQTIAILEVFDRAWQAFTPAERHELILVLVERVVVNVVAGSVEIAFHDLGGPFDAEPGGEPASGASVAAPAGPDEPAPDEAPFPWLAGRAAPSAAQEARP